VPAFTGYSGLLPASNLIALFELTAQAEIVRSPFWPRLRDVPDLVGGQTTPFAFAQVRSAAESFFRNCPRRLQPVADLLQSDSWRGSF
jgi:hypothetical protein